MQYKISLFYRLCLSAYLFVFAGVGFAQNEINNIEPLAAKSSEAVIFSLKYKNLNLKKAYNLQKAYVKNSVSKGVKIIGYKTGLTEEGSAQKVGLLEPITGVLMNKPLVGDGQIVSLKNTHKLMLEQTIAFRFAHATHKDMTLGELKQSVDAIAPSIELPDVSFSNENYNGLDIIANNAMAYKFIIGKWQSVPENIDNIEVSLTCDNRQVAKGEVNNSLGGQWQTLLWMVNHLASHGYNIQKDQIVISGSLVPEFEAIPCSYTANFGELGKILFKIEA